MVWFEGTTDNWQNLSILPRWYGSWYGTPQQQYERHEGNRVVTAGSAAPHRIPLGPPTSLNIPSYGMFSSLNR
jgi:hypothetical protein